MIRFDDLAHTAQSHTTDDEAPVIRFDDLAQPNPNPSQTDDEAEAAVEPEQVSFFGESKRSWHRVRQVIDASNRQLGAPIAAIGAAALLIVVLVLTGLHSANAPHHTQTSATALGKPVHRNHGSPRPSGSTRSTAPSTTTTTAPVVSAPNVSTNSSATYQVASGNFTLALSASHGQCWIRATDASGNVLFNGTLSEGQSQSVSASGPVTIVAGAPSVFTATVNGSPVSLPAGALAPLTLKFVSAVSTSA
jgi:cytoskeletal protein RodZ